MVDELRQDLVHDDPLVVVSNDLLRRLEVRRRWGRAGHIGQHGIVEHDEGTLQP